VTRERRLSLLKTVPGLLISVFFLWWTFRGISLSQLEAIRMVSPLWLVGVVVFSIAGYTTRCYRSYRMLRGVNARFYECARVFMTSLAANNILPLRIGDVMRIFTYSGDLNATPSIILSTVILEKLLDVFTLAVLFVVTMRAGHTVSPHLRLAAEVGLGISTAGLLVLVFGARALHAPVQKFFDRTANPRLKKLEHWLLLAMDCIQKIGVAGTLMLVLYSLIAWAFEGLFYVSAVRLVALPTDWAGPWQAVSQANLSFLIPSSPGGIGPFEWACKDALVRHGAAPVAAGLFGLLIHVYLLVTITAVGGAMFLSHRFGRRALNKPLIEEIETLPVELP
jgi:glycosyltransferase 2 family protein